MLSTLILLIALILRKTAVLMPLLLLATFCWIVCMLPMATLMVVLIAKLMVELTTESTVVLMAEFMAVLMGTLMEVLMNVYMLKLVPFPAVQVMINLLALILLLRKGNHGVAFRGIKEAFPDAVVTPDGIYQDTKPCHLYAHISVSSGITDNDHQLSTLACLEQRISQKNHSHGQLSRSFKVLQEQLLSKVDVGDVISVAFGSTCTASLGLKYQVVCKGIPSSGTGQWEKTLTGVILAVSKHDKSSSMIYAREVDSDFNGNGQPFQLWNKNGFVWENEYVSAEKLAFGSLVTFRKYHGFKCVYCNKVDVKPQDVTKIQMDLDDTECVFPGISDAFPKAKIHTKGLSMDEMPNPCIAAIGMKSAGIKNERIEFTSCQGEQISLKLLCREHLQLSASTIELQLRSSSDNLQDVALVKFVKTQHSLRHPRYSAVCVGLLLKFSPTVISITEEPVEIQHGNGAWMLVPGQVLFDTGNEMATGISEKLVDELDLQPDRRKLRKVVCGGGKELHCGRVAIEMKVRGHQFKVDNALVGAPAPDTDLLIGKDVIDQLIDRKYTFGE